MRLGIYQSVVLFLDLLILQSIVLLGWSRRHRSAPDNPGSNKLQSNDLETNPLTNTIDFIWYTQTVAAGDTAVLHCSFDAIFSQLRNGNVDWVKEGNGSGKGATLIATGKRVVIPNKRYRVFRPHNSALSVLIVRRAKKRDGGIYRCNLSGSSTRHKYLILNVTESKIEAQTSPAKLKARIGKGVTLWCNATGYPRPVVYWTREDSNHKLPDGTYQFWGSGLRVNQASEQDSGTYACYLDNFVQPVVSYKFNLVVEDRPWHLDGFKMRFDSSQWYAWDSDIPRPVQGKSYLLMCETRGLPKPLPKIRWYKDHREIRNNRHFYVIEDKPEWRTGYVSSTLVVMKFVPRHQANYTCIASNNFRTKIVEFHVHGYDPHVKAKAANRMTPTPPGNLPNKEDLEDNNDGAENVLETNNAQIVIENEEQLSNTKSNQEEDDDDEDDDVIRGSGNGPTDDEDFPEDDAGSASGDDGK